MGKALHLLLIEDSDDDAELLLHALRRGGYDIIYKRVDTLAAMRGALEKLGWDIVISDHAMPGFSAPAALAVCNEEYPEIPFIIVSGEIDLPLAVSLMKAGAADFIPKRELARVVPAVERELREVQVRRDRGQAVTALRQSKQSLESILESISDGFLVLDRDLRLAYYNHAAERLLGKRRDEVLGRKLSELFPETNGTVFEQRYIQALREGTSDSFDTHFGHGPRGNWCEVKISPFEGGIAIYLQIITERRRAEQNLRRERDLVERIMETSPAGIMTMDRTGQITFANQQAERVLGLTKNQITQRTYNAPEWQATDFDGNPYPSKQYPFDLVFRTRRHVRDIRMAIKWPDGRRVYLSINAAPLFEETGELDGVVANLTDVSSLILAERKP